MKIINIETHVCHARMRNWIFVKVLTDQPSLYGWGEATATRHFAAAVSNCPFTELYHPALFPSLPRQELAGPEPELKDGFWSLPEQPGLGVQLNEPLAERCLVKPIVSIER